MPLPLIKISDAVQKAAYDDLAKGSMRQFGDTIAVMVGRVLNPQRKSAEELALDWQRGEEESENRRRLAAEALDRVPIERRIFPAPQIAGPILRGSEFELPETPIWELWSRLLSRACDSSRVNEAHPAFPGIIGQLAVTEVVLINSYSASEFPILHVHRGLNPSTGQAGFTWRLAALDEQIPDRGLVSIYVEHLVQMGLIKEKPLVRPMVVRTREGDLHIDSQSITYPITTFGRLFLDAVVRPTSP